MVVALVLVLTAACTTPSTTTHTVTAGRPDFEPEGRIVLPVLIGLRTGQARRLLDGLDLDVSIGSDGRGSMGTILAQSEEPGSLLRPGTRITLVVSDGRDRSRAPS